jgi:hypothetical protein
MQINVHVVNLILGCLLLYPRHVVGSAFLLAVATHLKVSPAVLVLPFLFVRDVRWLAAYAASVGAIVAGTSAINGFGRYLEFMHNTSNIYAANGVVLRDNSIDSLVRATLQVFGGDLQWARVPVTLAKGALGLWLIWAAHRAARRETFTRGTGPEAVVSNAFVVLPFAMTMLSPLVWEHHPVFVLVPFLALLARASTPRQLGLLGLAYVLVFDVPTFDVYPFSFHRLAGMVAALFALGEMVREGATVEVPWVAAFGRKLRGLTAVGA